MGILGNLIGDSILSATTGIKTIHVQADQLANIIDETFIQPASGKAFLDQVHETIKGSKLFPKELESEDGKYRLYVSMFERGLTEHRTVWVKAYETNHVFEWNGYTLGPVKEAVEGKLAMREMRPFSSVAQNQSSASAGYTAISANMANSAAMPVNTVDGASAPAANSSSAGKTVIYCSYCGTMNQRGGRFCKECGQELRVVAASDADSTKAANKIEDEAMAPGGKQDEYNELIDYCLSALEKKGESYAKTQWSINVPARIERIKESNAPLASRLKRGYICIEDREWEEAKDFFDKALDIEAECVEAYFGLLMAEKQISEEQQLKIRNIDLEKNKNFQRVLRFSGEEDRQLFERFLETEDQRQLILAGLKAAALLDEDFISKEERYMKLFPDKWIFHEDHELWEIICQKKKEIEEEEAQKRPVYCDYCGVLNVGVTVCKECGRSLKGKLGI